MHKSQKTNEKAKLRQFVSLTNCSEKIALNCLSQNEWRLDVAIDAFFNNPEIYTKITDRKKLENWFYKYAQTGDKILSDGCIQLLTDLNLQPTDRKVLILAQKCRAQTQCEFTKQEFITGMSEMSCDSNQGLYQRLIEYDNEVSHDINKLRELYLFTWGYGKAHPDAKTMEWEIAVEYWNILLSQLVSPQMLQLWIQFVREIGKAVTKDTWNLFLEFVTSIDSALSNYDFDGAWPTMIDDFVLWARDRLKQHNHLM